MTIKEIELQVGITKANIRFYEKEGLLNPGRGSNNYREYGEEDVLRLKKIRVLRMMGISVAQIRLFIEGKCELSGLLDQRVKEIEQEAAALVLVRELCGEIRDREWKFDTLDPGFLDLRFREMKMTGGSFMKKDRIDKWCRIRDLAFLFCFVCIVSMIMFPINSILGLHVPKGILTVWTAVIGISPFPALILRAVTARRARWDVPVLNRILPDSGSMLKEVERGKGKGYETAKQFNQVCLLSLLVLPINRMLGITLPVWVMGIWTAVAAGSAVTLMVMKNRAPR